MDQTVCVLGDSRLSKQRCANRSLEDTSKLFQLLRSTLEMGGGGKDGPISVCFYSKQFKVCGLGYCGLVVRLQDLQSQGCGFKSYMYLAIS